MLMVGSREVHRGEPSSCERRQCRRALAAVLECGGLLHETQGYLSPPLIFLLGTVRACVRLLDCCDRWMHKVFIIYRSRHIKGVCRTGQPPEPGFLQLQQLVRLRGLLGGAARFSARRTTTACSG
jgi:hypothetical protein